jgi:murein L,D-transpeptidase YcbB/YkuD
MYGAGLVRTSVGDPECVQRNDHLRRLLSEYVATRNAVMRVGQAAVSLVIVALLAGCTDIDSAVASRGEVQRSAGGGASEQSESAEESSSEEPSASETADVTASESPDASEPTNEKADAEDDETDTKKRKKPRLATVKEGDQGADVEALQKRLDRRFRCWPASSRPERPMPRPSRRSRSSRPTLLS